MFREGESKQRVGTQAFGDAVVERLGDKPATLTPVSYRGGKIQVDARPVPRAEKSLRGVDVFLDWDREGRDPDVLGGGLKGAAPAGWRLEMITNRGVKVYPSGLPETFRSDHWRCRFVSQKDDEVTFPAVLELLGALHGSGFEVIKTEHLYTFDGERGFSLGQGQ